MHIYASIYHAFHTGLGDKVTFQSADSKDYCDTLLATCRSKKNPNPKLKQNAKTQVAAVIIMSTITDAEIKAEGLNVGAVDFIQQPVGDVELLARIQAQLRLKREVDKLRRKYGRGAVTRGSLIGRGQSKGRDGT